MTKSGLTNYTALSPNYSTRYQKIDKITVHHMAAVMSVEQCGNVFSTTARQASSNYGIGNDGRIGCYVEEQNQAWTSSNYDNDQRAITIEVSNSSTGGDWPVSDAAWKSLIKLCVDICKRYGITKLNWTGNASGNLTIHQFFAATACPGEYLKQRMGKLAAEVNEQLKSGKWVKGTGKNSAKWWYKYSDGSYPKSKWLKLDAWYYFDKNGWALTGWQKIGGKWYYFKSDCRMATGWISVGGKWYYMDDTGAMKTGWVKVKGIWYYLASDGAMVTGWLQLGGKWYYLGASGAMACNTFVKVSGKWYGFGSDGVMKTSFTTDAKGAVKF